MFRKTEYLMSSYLTMSKHCFNDAFDSITYLFPHLLCTDLCGNTLLRRPLILYLNNMSPFSLNNSKQYWHIHNMQTPIWKCLIRVCGLSDVEGRIRSPGDLALSVGWLAVMLFNQMSNIGMLETTWKLLLWVRGFTSAGRRRRQNTRWTLCSRFQLF